jgi:hypothetical protein
MEFGFLKPNLMGASELRTYIAMVPIWSPLARLECAAPASPGLEPFPCRGHGVQRTNEGSPARWRLAN